MEYLYNDEETAASTTWTITNTDSTTWVEPTYNDIVSEPGTIIWPEPGTIVWGQKPLKKKNSDWDEVDKMFKEEL